MHSIGVLMASNARRRCAQMDRLPQMGLGWLAMEGLAKETMMHRVHCKRPSPGAFFQCVEEEHDYARLQGPVQTAVYWIKQ